MIDRLIDIPSGNTSSEDPAVVICLLYTQKAHYLILQQNWHSTFLTISTLITIDN